MKGLYANFTQNLHPGRAREDILVSSIPVRSQMEKERSKRVEEANKESRKKIETNSSRLTTREIIAKRIKRNLSQDAAVPQTITGKSSRFLGAVSRRYPGRKQSLLKRLSECSLSPCSEEYACVMQGFKETEVEPESIFVAPSRQTRNRKISFNGFGQGSKYSSAKLSSEFESALSFRPRPRGNTLPARINDVKVIPTAGTLQPGGKTKPAADRHVLDVKLAWQGTNDDLNLPTKKLEKKRHVSLSDLPQRQLSGGTREEKNNRKLSETFQNELLPGRSDKSGRKIPQRKKPDIDLPKIEEIILTDHLQIKASDAEICQHENRGNVITAEQTDDENPALQRLASIPQRERSYSSEYFTDSKGTTSRVKAKLSYSISSGPVLCNRSTTEANWNRRDIDAESPKNYFETQLGQPSSSIGRRTSQFAITRANISRVGKAALVASRLLKIHYRENGAKKVSITEEEKELEKLFEEMKDCRYLRKNTSEMKI